MTRIGTINYSMEHNIESLLSHCTKRTLHDISSLTKEKVSPAYEILTPNLQID